MPQNQEDDCCDECGGLGPGGGEVEEERIQIWMCTLGARGVERDQRGVGLDCPLQGHRTRQLCKAKSPKYLHRVHNGVRVKLTMTRYGTIHVFHFLWH